MVASPVEAGLDFCMSHLQTLHFVITLIQVKVYFTPVSEFVPQQRTLYILECYTYSPNTS